MVLVRFHRKKHTFAPHAHYNCSAHGRENTNLHKIEQKFQSNIYIFQICLKCRAHDIIFVNDRFISESRFTNKICSFSVRNDKICYEQMPA